VLESSQNYLYKLAWQDNPNALMAVNSNLEIELVNPAFCLLFKLEDNNFLGKLALDILGEVGHLQQVWQTQKNVNNQIREYVKAKIFVKESIFPIPEKDLILCIMIDLTEDVQRKKELNKMQEEMIQKVNIVVNNQMKVAQEIAGLLGETTAETKVNLFKLLELFNN
jgi:transcriptional regulator with PAS, ATPase and Fis domain